MVLVFGLPLALHHLSSSHWFIGRNADSPVRYQVIPLCLVHRNATPTHIPFPCHAGTVSTDSFLTCLGWFLCLAPHRESFLFFIPPFSGSETHLTTIHMGARRVLLLLVLTTHNFSSFTLFNSLNSGLLTSPVVVFMCFFRLEYLGFALRASLLRWNWQSQQKVKTKN
jgi:hypothetical protein